MINELAGEQTSEKAEAETDKPEVTDKRGQLERFRGHGEMNYVL